MADKHELLLKRLNDLVEEVTRLRRMVTRSDFTAPKPEGAQETVVLPTRMLEADVIRGYFLSEFARVGYNRTHVADSLGISRRTVPNRLREYRKMGYLISVPDSLSRSEMRDRGLPVTKASGNPDDFCIRADLCKTPTQCRYKGRCSSTAEDCPDDLE